jgi:flagellin
MEEIMSQGLSIANNLLANQVQLNLDNNQKQLQNVVTQLSSGLRINSAADDPSGNAIATNLQTQADAFNQASQNVQNANNAAQVALGALTQETNILQQIRSLAVEAASDVNSTSDRANLQTEVSQLLDEVNRISQNTNFNGQALLDGSHAGYQGATDAYTSITANAALASGSFLIATVAQTTGWATTTGASADETIEVQAIPNATNPSLGAPQLQVTVFASGAVGTFAANSVVYKTTLSGANLTIDGTNFDNTGLNVTFASSSLQDLGTTAYLKVSQFVPTSTAASNPAFNFQSGADEGDIIQLGIAATNTSTLRISNINLAASVAGQPSLAAEDAIGQIDIALQTLTTQQAQLGSVVDRLNIDQDNDNTAATNLQASESNIRDLNVGQATTNFTRLQILVQVGTSVLAQSNANAQTVLGLFR